MANSVKEPAYPSCFVCGCRNTGAHELYIRQTRQPGPYFPFLETHERPDGAVLPTKCGKVLSCYACYAFLIQQWKSYEKNEIPLVKRIYWLKRVDNGPYTGVEMGMQSEYASQVFGLTSESPGHVEIKKTNSIIPKVEPDHGSSAMSSHLSFANLNDSISSSSSHNSIATKKQDVQQEALDLTIERPRRKRKIDSFQTNETLKKKSYESVNAEVLDLSMPDKNAATEVCYICGNHFEKGTLSDIFAINLNKYCPFFPSLMQHSRPSGSRPMEPPGKVSGCEECFQFLLSQWRSYENLKVPYTKRNYILKRQSNYEVPKLMCYKCGKITPQSNIHLVYCQPNSEGKPYFPQLRSASPKFGALPTIPPSPTVEVNICSACYKDLEQEFVTNTKSPVNFKIKPFRAENTYQKMYSSALTSDSIGVVHKMPSYSQSLEFDAGLDSVSCCLCHQSYSLKQMQTLSMVPDPLNSHEMFFPFLKFLPRVNHNMITEDGRILACKACYMHLSSQWHEYEKDNISADQRHFSLRALSVDSQSPRLTPISNYTPPPHLLSGQSTPSESSTTPLNNLLSQQGNIREAANGETHRVDSHSVKTFNGQSLKELEVVAVSDESLKLQAVTTQRALNISINCYICSFHSKAGQTYSIKSKANGKEIFFPFFNKHVSAHPEAVVDDVTYLVCLICFHSLVIQWQHYEKNRIEYHARFYDIYNFSCYICGTKTYRKRLYLLPVKDYPFLKEHACPPGGMVVNNGHSVVICKDCYISLNEQSTALERLGVPVEKRQYNWIQRPPPPEFPEDPPFSVKPKVLSIQQSGTDSPASLKKVKEEQPSQGKISSISEDQTSKKVNPLS